jgi:hypothetical protein
MGRGEGLTNPKQPVLDCVLFQSCHLRELSYREALELLGNLKQPTAAFRDICQQLVDEVLFAWQFDRV